MPDLSAVRDRLLKRQAELRHRTERANADLRHERDPLAADFADQAVQRATTMCWRRSAIPPRAS